MGKTSSYRLGLALILGALFFSPAHARAISVGTLAPNITGKVWLNSGPLTINDLKGRVVMVEFWTYG